MMWETYDEYCCTMQKFNTEPLSEEIWKREYRSESQQKMPLVIKPKHRSNINDHIKVVNNIRDILSKAKRKVKEAIEKEKKPKAVKPPKEPKPRYKPQKIYTDEEIKERRAQRRKAKREALKAQGLTVRGTPRVVREKKVLSQEEKKERQKRYAKNWREKHREQHLAYRKSYRLRQREADRKYRADNIEAVREYQAAWARANRAKKRESSTPTSAKSGCAA